MFTDADSLCLLVSFFSRWTPLRGQSSYLPAIVRIAVDVKDLVSFDTQDTRKRVRKLFTIHQKINTHPESTHSVKPIYRVSGQ